MLEGFSTSAALVIPVRCNSMSLPNSSAPILPAGARSLPVTTSPQSTTLMRCQRSLSQRLEEALQVTTGSGAAGVGNPAYVLLRLKALAEDDFLSSFVYDKGAG